MFFYLPSGTYLLSLFGSAAAALLLTATVLTFSNEELVYKGIKGG